MVNHSKSWNKEMGQKKYPKKHSCQTLQKHLYNWLYVLVSSMDVDLANILEYLV